jgi:hypothetical protein
LTTLVTARRYDDSGSLTPSMKWHWALPRLVNAEKLCGKEGELWLLVLAGQSSLYLQFLRCLSSTDKSGVARLCSVMVEMGSFKGRTGLSGAGQEDSYATVTYTTLSYYLSNYLKTLDTSLQENKLWVHNGNCTLCGWWHQNYNLSEWRSFCVRIVRRFDEDSCWRMNSLESWGPLIHSIQRSPLLQTCTVGSFWKLGGFLILRRSNHIFLLCDSGSYWPNDRVDSYMMN